MDQDLQVKTYFPAKSLGDARRRAAIMLLVATSIAAVLCVTIFIGVLHGEWMTGMFSSVAEAMFNRPVWSIVAATSPLATALLVGYGYMQKAIRRRSADKEAALHNAPTPTDLPA